MNREERDAGGPMPAHGVGPPASGTTRSGMRCGAEVERLAGIAGGGELTELVQRRAGHVAVRAAAVSTAGQPALGSALASLGARVTEHVRRSASWRRGCAGWPAPSPWQGPQPDR